MTHTITRRPVLSMLFWIAMLFVIIPAMVLGTPLFLELTSKWFRSVTLTGADDFLVHFNAYITSLHYAVLSWLSDGNLSTLSAQSLHSVKLLIVALLQVVLVVLGVAYVVCDTRVRLTPDVNSGHQQCSCRTFPPVEFLFICSGG